MTRALSLTILTKFGMAIAAQLSQEFIALQKTKIRATTFKRNRLADSDAGGLWAHRINSDACLKWLRWYSRCDGSVANDPKRRLRWSDIYLFRFSKVPLARVQWHDWHLADNPVASALVRFRTRADKGGF